jgi:cob(I)alamin adenosyltransferase
MGAGIVEIYAGQGKGKSSAAFGRAVKKAAEGASVVIIHFLKGKEKPIDDFLRRLEPEIKSFRFEKSSESFESLNEERKEEEIQNLKNGICYAKKVLQTGECDLLVLDEVLGVLENGIITTEELQKVLESRGETDIILTGIHLSAEICDMADEISQIETIKTLEVHK